MRRRVKSVMASVLALVLAGSFSGCYLLPDEEKALEVPLLESKEVVYTTHEVKRGELVSYISTTARFVSASQSDCFFEYKGGRLRVINIRRGDAVEEGDVIAELDTDSLVQAKTIQYYVMQKAKLYYEHLQSVGAGSYEIKMAEYDYKIARTNYNAAVDELEKSVLRAPMSGIVTYVADLVPGDTISAYTDLARIVDPENVCLVIEGNSAADFKTGMEVEVTIENEVYEGTVIESPGDLPLIPADGDTTKKAYIQIDGYEPDKNVLGNSAKVKFIEDSRSDVIVIPKSLVNTYQGRTYVKVLVDGEKIEVDVEEGLKTSTQVEIVKGLSEGDLVIIS